MASLPTGSQSLRGVGPRAPTINSEAFVLDTERIGRAATMPVRVLDTWETFDAKNRDRAIERETFPMRRQIARMQAQTDLAVAPFENRTRIGQAQGAAGRVRREQDLQSMTLDRDITEFSDVTEARAAQRRAAIAKARAQAEQDAQELAALEATEAENLDYARQQAQSRFRTGQIQQVEQSQRMEDLEGTPFTDLTETEEGVFETTGTVVPTGERVVRSVRQRKTPSEMEASRINLQNAKTRAEAYAQSIAQQGRGRPNILPNTNRITGETIGFNVVVTDPNGGVLSVESFDVSQGVPTRTGGFQAPAAQAGQGVGRGSGIEEMRAGLGDVGTAPPATGRQVTEFGNTFVPTGRDMGGFQRGRVYRHPQLGRVLYTGGDPFNPANYQPIQ